MSVEQTVNGLEQKKEPEIFDLPEPLFNAVCQRLPLRDRTLKGFAQYCSKERFREVRNVGVKKVEKLSKIMKTHGIRWR